MVKQVKWTSQAKIHLNDILRYWIERNGNSIYSKKLNYLFKSSSKQLLDFPFIGKKSSFEGVRFRIVRDYFMFYEIIQSTIYILAIWDSRQDPEKLKELFLK